MIDLSPHARGTVLNVHAQPGARRNGVLGERAGALRLAVTAAPERGKANAAIADLLGELLGCRTSEVSLLSGETSRRKRFLLAGKTPDELRPLIQALLPDAESTPTPS
jgi:uncharacterized protein (TIGR00251 family)